MKINNITVKAPLANKFNIDLIEISVSDRTASGRLVTDIIAVKHRFKLSYNGLKYIDYKTFLDVFMNGYPVPFEYLDNDVEKSSIVKIMSMPRGIYQEKSTISHSISITLEEV